jgi:hypothetical protein
MSPLSVKTPPSLPASGATATFASCGATLFTVIAAVSMSLL